MSEAASHAASAERRGTLEQEARSLFGKKADAIQAHLVVDATANITSKDDGLTHNTWIASYALARATTIIVWLCGEVQRLELEAIGQERLFDEDAL